MRHRGGEHASRPATCSGTGHSQHPGGGLRQGRGGQVHHRRQPGAGAEQGGGAGRHPGCGHLWSLHSDHDGHPQGASRQPRRQDHGAGDGLWPQEQQHRLPGGRAGCHHLARSHGEQGAGADPARDPLGRGGLSGGGHAAGHRRHPAHPGPAGTHHGGADRHHAAGRGAGGRTQGHRHVQQGACAGARHHREHELSRLQRLRSSRGAVRDRWRPEDGRAVSSGTAWPAAAAHRHPSAHGQWDSHRVRCAGRGVG
ncbi:hypothetical protein D3C85_1175620 [compost metagenome]